MNWRICTPFYKVFLNLVYVAARLLYSLCSNKGIGFIPANNGTFELLYLQKFLNCKITKTAGTKTASQIQHLQND